MYQFTREILSNKKPNFIKIGDGGEAGEGGGGVEEVDSGGVDDGAKLKEELETHIDHDDDDRHGRYYSDHIFLRSIFESELIIILKPL